VRVHLDVLDLGVPSHGRVVPLRARCLLNSG
jgi:hypothetical protein